MVETVVRQTVGGPDHLEFHGLLEPLMNSFYSAQDERRVT